MELTETARLEGLLFISGEAMSPGEIAEIMGIRPESVRLLLDEYGELLRQDAGRGLELREINGAFALALKIENKELARRYFKPGQLPQLSSAAYETLAAVLYNQPVTRAQVEAVRGVNSDGLMSRLEERGLIENCGVLEQPGRPSLYRVTDKFLLESGLSSAEELPPMDLLMYETIRKLEEGE